VIAGHPRGIYDAVQFAQTAIVKTAAATDQAAQPRLEAAVHAHFTLVWRLLRRLGVPAQSVDDAAQQVFLIAVSRANDIEEGRERAFLCGCAVKVASNMRRVERRTAPSDDGDSQPNPTPTADVLVDQKRAREVLDSVLAEMDDDLRVVLILFELEGMKTADIAEIVDVPVGTAASRLRRAREELTRLVRARGYGDRR
jgi:RNA polymerase sigma-70 factor (ECF subfamily)